MDDESRKYCRSIAMVGTNLKAASLGELLFCILELRVMLDFLF